MRLIDADAFIEYVNRGFDLCSDELRMMIEEQPTAYDISEFQKLKEKDTPKKIIKTIRNTQFCGECQHIISNNGKIKNYCGWCGQKLDWD